MLRVPLRIGLLSTARINLTLLEAARAGDAAEVVAVASRDASQAAEYAHRHGIATAHAGYLQLLADTDVEAVYISAPNALHVEWVLRAIAAGKHVLCEKPLTRSGEQARRVVAAAERAGVVLAEGFMYRHHPQTRALAEMVAVGAIGDLERVSARFAFTADPGQDAVLFDPRLDGGALLDVGCYCVSAARLLAGEPTQVTARMVTGTSGVDLRFEATLEFGGGVVGELAAALDLPDDAGLVVTGSRTTATVADPWHCLAPGISLGEGEQVAIAAADPYRLQLEDFAAAVRESRPALVSGAEIVGQARALQALIESARLGGTRLEIATERP
ncbi:MAG: D-xylose 1-dehydrogenase D-xylono,5-lactone-forming [Gaiellales bacterium]|nr:D-xylose 1-dehydrogenase D-xylono,5-lactone-forming [Gaiellales bacterium]